MDIAGIVRQWGPSLGRGEASAETVTVSGLVVSAYQEGGRLAFWTVNDATAEVQVALTPQRLGEAEFEIALTVREGQEMQVSGELTRSRRGMLTILAATATPAS